MARALMTGLLILLFAACARPSDEASLSNKHFRLVFLGAGYPNAGPDRSGPALIEPARGVDILVHEVYSTAGFGTSTPEWQAYHKSFHPSTAELTQIAKMAQPKLPVLFHQLYWTPDDDDLIAEIRAAGYEGEVVSAQDLNVF